MGVLTVGVADAELASVALYTPLPWLMRLDLLPFLFLYATAAYLYTLRPEDDVVPWVFGALIVFCHALALLGTEWSVDVRCWMSCVRLKAVVEDKRVQMLAKVDPSLSMLPKQLCECQLNRQDKKLKDAQVPTLWFSYQNLKFCLYEDVETINSSSDTQFRRLQFPSSDTLASYLQSEGIQSSDELQQARGKYGRNDFELPMPRFTELLKEQLVAPFFVFQFFCMLLWCLDEYMYYSLLTLLMLVIFECTVVKQRQQNMDTLLHMRRAPQPCLVYRLGTWTQVSSDELVPEIQAVDILHSFTFSSELKRMTTVVTVRKADNDEQDEQRVLTKGAPEVLEPIFSTKPSYYRRVYRHYASKGCRVLALGFRVLPVAISPEELRRKPRCELEGGLTFAGFLVMDCPLKDDTKRTIRELMISKHKVTMVTGDNPLTACDVARQVGINSEYSKQPLVLTPNTESGVVEWKSIDDGSPDIEEETIPFNVDGVEKMQVQYDMCVTGEALAMLYKQQEDKCSDSAAALEGFLAILGKICLCITVFARTSPQQKEHLIMAMNRRGKTTAMCGDGTNDVGALKQAHIGISIVNSSSSENPPHVVDAGRGAGRFTAQNGLRHRRHPGSRGNSVEELQQSLYTNDDVQIVRLGDASIASPFTSKSSSIRVIKKLIRQGRCTLVTTIQMYKILGINCLITAYYLSSLFILGVKNGDQQLTISGLSIAMFFLFLSRAKPARKLSHQRPPSGVFCISVLVSIFGQFVIHLAFLAAALRVAQPFIEPGDPAMHPDGNFTPNVVNSIMFLMSSIMQLNTFVANYRGQPFMEGFWENKLLYRSALFNYAVLAAVIAEVFTPINAVLELVAMPNPKTQLMVAALMAGDTIVTLTFEHAVQMIVFVAA
ncbi:hypothetical protein PRIC2_010295 [Phytophthora ramorum]